MTKFHYGVITVLIVVGFGLGGLIFYKKSPPPPATPAVSPEQAAAKALESIMSQATPENIKKLTDNFKDINKGSDDSAETPKTDDTPGADEKAEASQDKPTTDEKPKADDAP